MKRILSVTIAIAALSNALRGSEPPWGGSEICAIYTGATEDDLKSVRKQFQKKLEVLDFIAAEYPKFAPDGPGNTEELKEYSWFRLATVEDAEVYVYVLLRKDQILSQVRWEVESALLRSSPERVWEIHEKVTSMCLGFLNWSKNLTPKNLTELRMLQNFTTILENELMRNTKP